MIRLFKVFVPATVLALLISESLIILASYIFASFFLLSLSYDAQTFLIDEFGYARIAILTVVIVIALYFNELYNEIRIQSRMVLFQQLCASMGVVFLAQALIGYVARSLIIPRTLM